MTTDPLEGMLQRCSLHALLIVTERALTRSGFGDVEILDRRGSKQKSRFGGFEIQCTTRLGTEQVRVAIKVIRDPIRTRMLDEMVGTVARVRVDAGIVISPFKISPSKAKTQVNYPGSHLTVIDGPALARLMRCSGVGVRAKGEVDYAFFSELERVACELEMFIASFR